MEQRTEDYCKCENRSGTRSAVGEWGYWLICSDCEKVVEDSFEYYNHYDGEDHYESDCW